MTPQFLVPLILAPFLALILLRRLRLAGKDIPLKIERLWIAPAIFGVMAAVILAGIPPHGMQWAWLALSAALGCVVGWYRGRMMRITVDPETHKLNQATSPAAIVFILAIVVVRYGLRTLLASEAETWQLDAVFITDIFLVFVVGMIALQRVEMAIRAQRLLAAARAAKAD